MLLVGKLRVPSVIRRLSGIRANSVVQEQIEDFEVKNEPIKQYEPGSKEREHLIEAIAKWSKKTTEIPVIIGGKEFTSNETVNQVAPHNKKQILAKINYASEVMIRSAIETAVKAQKEWAEVPWSEKIKIFQKAADLMATKYKYDLNATTMLGQSKTVYQAEIDSACELTDFFNFNTYYLKELLKYKPISEDPNVTLNSVKFRGLEGFVAAVSPFNFTAIGGNLAYAPALMGNVVLWKPSDTAALSNYLIYRIVEEAGIPPGVVNFVPANGPIFGDTITADKNLAAINFTGSARTFNRLWKQVGSNVATYKSYPRLIGECGGKNFHFVHPSADLESTIIHTARSAFEYQGQKCSACSRLYVPKSLWPKMKEGLLQIVKEMKVGDPTDFKTFIGAVIDDIAFERIKSYIDVAKKDSNFEILTGGHCDKSVGYFVEPTIVLAKNPVNKLMVEEIFGPVLTVFVYEDKDVLPTLQLIDTSTPYALTGAVFSTDSKFLKDSQKILSQSAGNFYINDKSTGAVVAQQPFGGSRKSGTNDKAGGPHYLLRFTSVQAIKETFVPFNDWRYPYMK